MLLLNTSARGFRSTSFNRNRRKNGRALTRRSDAFANDDIAPLKSLHRTGRLRERAKADDWRRLCSPTIRPRVAPGGTPKTGGRAIRV